MSTLTLKSSCKTMTVGTHCGANEIVLHECNVVSIDNHVSSRLEVGFHPTAPVQVGLINEAQLRHGPGLLERMDPDPSGGKSDHTPYVHIATTDPIQLSSTESDSKGDKEVYMVGQ
jgi:hypothetical protein